MPLKETLLKPHQFILKNFLVLSVSLSVLSIIYFAIYKPTLTPPSGINPLTSVDLHQIQGPWFEVARLSSPIEQGIKDPILFIKFAGKGGDLLYAFDDPKDPRFKLSLLGTNEHGQKETVWSQMSAPLRDYQTGTLSMSFWGLIPSAFHLIDYDEDQRSWMIIAGPFKNQLWIFSRTPGLLPQSLDMLKKRIAEWGYNVSALTYSNELPRIPEIFPENPSVLPPIPDFIPGASREK
jgi:apolipoprotein D and lipocalin family protein